MSGEYDFDDPVELRIRGWFADVVGVISALGRIEDFKGDFDGLGRIEKSASDIIDQTDKQVNLGYLTRQFKRAENNPDEFPDYGGVQVFLSEFDARDPLESATELEQLTPLDEAEFYIILLRSESGFEAAGWPAQLDIEQNMLLASFLRMYARELERNVEEITDDPMAGRSGGE